MAVFGIVSIIISVSSNRFIWRPPSSVATVAHRIPSETAILLAVVLCIEDCWPRMESRRSGANICIRDSSCATSSGQSVSGFN